MAKYRWRILDDGSTPEFADAGSEDMACGSLVDAIVTKGLQIDIDAPIDADKVKAALASSYDDGSKNLEWLTTKKGWTAGAIRAVKSAERLMLDPVARNLIDRAKKQVHFDVEICDGIFWAGDIDLLIRDDNQPHIIDLKSPGRIKEDWIVSGGKNVKVEWYDSRQYWFQLAGYAWCMGLQHAKTGLLYTTREEIPRIGYQPIANHAQLWRDIVTNPMRAPLMAQIARGEIDAPKCGKCPYCASKSIVELADPISEPVFDDVFGINRIFN